MIKNTKFSNINPEKIGSFSLIFFDVRVESWSFLRVCRALKRFRDKPWCSDIRSYSANDIRGKSLLKSSQLLMSTLNLYI